MLLTNNHRIEVFREDGTFVRQFGTGERCSPWNVTVNNQLVMLLNVKPQNIHLHPGGSAHTYHRITR